MKGTGILDALKRLDVRDRSYDEWIRIGMALKNAGFDCREWDDWSRDDPRYNEGECQKKWDSFKGSEDPVTGATILAMAKEAGWMPPAGNGIPWARRNAPSGRCLSRESECGM